jgi:hypothetical protein
MPIDFGSVSTAREVPEIMIFLTIPRTPAEMQALIPKWVPLPVYEKKDMPEGIKFLQAKNLDVSQIIDQLISEGFKVIQIGNEPRTQGSRRVSIQLRKKGDALDPAKVREVVETVFTKLSADGMAFRNPGLDLDSSNIVIMLGKPDMRPEGINTVSGELIVDDGDIGVTDYGKNAAVA